MKKVMILMVLFTCLAFRPRSLPKSLEIEDIYQNRQSTLKETISSNKQIILLVSLNCSHCLRQLRLLQKCPENPLIVLSIDGHKRELKKKFYPFKNLLSFYKTRDQVPEEWKHHPTPSFLFTNNKKEIHKKYSGVLSCSEIKARK